MALIFLAFTSVQSRAFFVADDASGAPYPTSPDMPDLQAGTFVLRKMSVTPESAHPQPIQPCDVLTTITVEIDDTGTYDVTLLDSYAGQCGGAPQLSLTPRTYYLMRDTRFPFPCGVAYVSYQQVESQSGSFPEFTLKDYRYAPQSCRQTDLSGHYPITALFVANEWSQSGMIEWGSYPNNE